MKYAAESLPTDLGAAHAMFLVERHARLTAEANAQLPRSRRGRANAQADLSSSEALIAHLKLAIVKLRSELYGRARSARRGCWVKRLHGEDTTVPILAKDKTIRGHIWTYVRDHRPFGGHAPPGALYYAARNRRHEHPARHLQGFTGILQADAYGGY
jgi:transposase